VIDYCGTISWELVSSNITNATDPVLPSGHISVRVNPDELQKLLAFVELQGRVAEHSTESEDKTGQVGDIEAKIKNLTVFRDNLRSMPSHSSVTKIDSVEIQSQLMAVQAQLDSETAGGKALVNETEKVAVDIASANLECATQLGIHSCREHGLVNHGGDDPAAMVYRRCAITTVYHEPKPAVQEVLTSCAARKEHD
jgi:hypothetical protein